VHVALLKAMLVNVADEICAVLDSNEAEQAFKDFAPDLVLLDLHMPQPDGLEILRRLRVGRDSVRFPPVIVLTEEERSLSTGMRLCSGCAITSGRGISSRRSNVLPAATPLAANQSDGRAGLALPSA